MSLKDFAEKNPAPQCRLCSLPEKIRTEVDEGLRGGIAPVVVAKWLESEGYEISRAKVSHHKGAHVIS